MKRKTQNLTVTFINPYLLDCIDPEGYEIVCNLDKEKLQFLYNTFIKEYWHEYNKKYYKNIISAFSSYLQGLPSCYHVDFENYVILQIAKKWGSIPENATEKQEDKILENWFNFIANKTFQLFKKYKIDQHSN